MMLNANGRRTLAYIVCLLVIAIASTVLRFWCKVRARMGLHAEDWWILATLLMYIGTQVAMLWGLLAGSDGNEIQQIEMEVSPSPALAAGLSNYLKSLFISLTISYGVLFAVKIAICLMYHRIFSAPRYHIMAKMLMGFAAAWFVSTFVADMWYCVPMESFWDSSIPGRCIDFDLFYLLDGIFGVLIDAAILTLPVWAVSSLQMPIQTRLLVICMFMLGGFAVVTNILRVAYSYQPDVEFVSFTKAQLWLTIHMCTAIVCANLPLYMPLRAQVGRLFRALRDRLSGVSPHGLFHGRVPSRNGGSNSTSRRWNNSGSNATQDSAVYYPMGVRPTASLAPFSKKKERPDPFYGLEPGSHAGERARNSLVLRPGEVESTVVIGRGRPSLEDVVVPPGGIGKTTKVEVV